MRYKYNVNWSRRQVCLIVLKGRVYTGVRGRVCLRAYYGTSDCATSFPHQIKALYTKEEWVGWGVLLSEVRKRRRKKGVTKR